MTTSRRDFLRTLGLGAAALAAPRWLHAAPKDRPLDPPRGRPNILLIMCDDMGFSDIAPYGGEIETPHLSTLAQGGIRFTQFYNTARCCPTRASLLTGLYPHQAGVGHMTEDRAVPGYRGALNRSCVTLAEALRPAGYRTLMVGKWHVGERRPHWPCDRGFDHYFGLVSGGSNYWRLDPGRVMATDNTPYAPPTDGSFYMTHAFTDRAVAFLDRFGREDRPFFLYLAYTAPHWPLHALPSDIAKYRGQYRKGWDALRAERHARQLAMGLVRKDWALTPRDPDAPDWSKLDAKQRDLLDLKMAVYAAQVDAVDQGIGKLVAKLRQLGKLDNTLLLFLSDNGGCAEAIERGKPGAEPGTPDSFTSYGLPWANASNTPFRRYKHWVHEGGIASPLLVHWPARIQPGGGFCHQPGHVIDLMATCLDVAGAAYPTEHEGNPITPLEGRSLLPAFEGREAAPGRVLFWEHEGNRAVRQGRWKLVSKHPGPWELYDLAADRTELHDLAAQHPDTVKEMATLYDAWATRAHVLPWPDLPRPGGTPKAKAAKGASPK